MIFRLYTHQDQDACMALFDSNMDKYFVPRERAEFHAFLNPKPNDYYVIEAAEGQILACGGIHVDENGVGRLTWGMSHRERHGQGLGKMLTQRRLELIKANPNARTVLLDTSQHTSGFYEKFGFQVTKIIKDGFGPNLHHYEMRLDFHR